MKNLPSFTNYGNYNSDNYGAHSLVFSIGNIYVYFSYKTPVAYRVNGILTCSENVWGTTTGKHLNWIQPDKKKRISNTEFQERLAELMEFDLILTINGGNYGK